MSTLAHTGELVHTVCACRALAGPLGGLQVAGHRGSSWQFPEGTQAASLVLTGVHELFLHTLLALHIAAPLHLAVAGEGHQAALGVIAPPAAEAAATGLPGAHPAPCARRVLAGPAETG